MDLTGAADAEGRAVVGGRPVRAPDVGDHGGGGVGVGHPGQPAEEAGALDLDLVLAVPGEDEQRVRHSGDATGRRDHPAVIVAFGYAV